MMEFRDQMGNTIRLPDYPGRIISLVPSLTELLFDLGLDDEIVGVTRYCVLPKDKVGDRARVGGTKDFDFPVIDGLHPELIIGNKEENDREGIRRLQARYPVWISDVVTIEDALEMIGSVGELVDRCAVAERLIEEIGTSLDRLERYPPLKAAYLIWKNPYMVAAGNTFINEMLRRCGFVNIFESQNGYPETTLEELDEADVVLLSSEPYPFVAEDMESFRKGLPIRRAYLVDGAMFSWYGSRMKYAASYFRGLRESLELL